MNERLDKVALSEQKIRYSVQLIVSFLRKQHRLKKNTEYKVDDLLVKLGGGSISTEETTTIKQILSQDKNILHTSEEKIKYKPRYPRRPQSELMVLIQEELNAGHIGVKLADVEECVQNARPALVTLQDQDKIYFFKVTEDPTQETYVSLKTDQNDRSGFRIVRLF